MGRKRSTKTQSKFPNTNKTQKTNVSKAPTTAASTATTSSPLGSTIKQGIATGVGFGIGNAVTSGIINTISSTETDECPISKVDKPIINIDCNKYFELYYKCIENNEDYKCKFLLDEFYKCTT